MSATDFTSLAVSNAYGIVAPVADFADSEAKITWEREYPNVLQSYYYAVAALAVGANSGVSRPFHGRVTPVDVARQTAFASVELSRVASTIGGGGAGAGGAPDGGVPSVGSSSDGNVAADSTGCYCSQQRQLGDSVTVAGSGSESSNNEFPGRCGNDNGDRGGFVLGAMKRGPNFEKNKRSRDLKKQRKLVRKAVENVPEWRRRAGPDRVQACDVVSHNRESFFSGCEKSVRDQLRESRAAMLIAQNKRKAVEADIKIRRLESVSSEAVLVSEMIRVTRMANQLKRQTKDDKIGGWAETVADSLTKSVAESAPSSVPSLQSVGYGNSALKSSGGSVTESLKSVREIEYDMALRAVEDEFDDLEVYSEQDRLDRLSLVREYYSDVSKTSEERLRDDLLLKISNEMHNEGIGFQRVDDIIDRVKNM